MSGTPSLTVNANMESAVPSTDNEQKQAAEPKAPYYRYRDHSHLMDPDPNKPVTIPGRIPTFPAKLFAILSRPDLSDIISWMPHGRSWKVHKPREFEVKVIPLYFDHAKFSSFIRQANGWGFKRVTTKGTDRNSHYHELFLRGIPHLIKFMKRPVSGMNAINQSQFTKGKDLDPDFYRISDEFPLPEFAPKMIHPLDETHFLNSAKNSNLVFGSAFGPQCDSHTMPLVPSIPITEPIPQIPSSLCEQDSGLHDSFSEHACTPIAPSASLLLPRGVDNQSFDYISTSFHAAAQVEAPSMICPVRQQEKDLDPLTILLNDLSEDDTLIEDQVIQSLINDPAVPPPSSLKSNPFSFATAVVSPAEEKPILHLAFESLDQSALEYILDDSSLDRPFPIGLSAHDFY